MKLTAQLYPASTDHDLGYPDGLILARVPMRKEFGWYICTVHEDGKLFTKTGDPVGWKFSNVDYWCPISELQVSE